VRTVILFCSHFIQKLILVPLVPTQYDPQVEFHKLMINYDKILTP